MSYATQPCYLISEAILHVGYGICQYVLTNLAFSFNLKGGVSGPNGSPSRLEGENDVAQ